MFNFCELFFKELLMFYAFELMLFADAKVITAII